MKKASSIVKLCRNADRWQELLYDSVVSADELAHYLPIDIEKIQKVIAKYPMRINRYFLSLIETAEDAVWKQVVPDIKEIEDTPYGDDPLAEDDLSPVPGIIHRYPDRVLFMVSGRCGVYCRFCLRKRNVGTEKAYAGDEKVALGLEYLNKNRNIREVILSGGDPLLLDDDHIDSLLHRLRSISHIEVIRIHTRVPCVLPQRVTARLCAILKRYHPLFINTHFNHPVEISHQAARACVLLADAGIPLGCQTVLLKGVNDNPIIIRQLLEKLVRVRVKPYYLHHADPVKGTAHFRTSLKSGLKIMRSLRGNISGMCIPDYVIDLPGGKGKVPVLPDYIKAGDENRLVVENYKGKRYEYPLK